jgi:hypothetical protein
MQYNIDTKTLIISFDFNKKLKDIPNDTEIIIFFKKFQYSKFNQKVYNLPKYFLGFPQNLTHLTFGYYFNKKIDNLPKNLTHLTFGYYFNQKVDNFPKNLTHLTFDHYFNKKLDNLPKNLKYLQIKWYYNNKIILPKSLKELSLTCNNDLINNIPEHIEKVYILFYYYNEVKNKKIENLPPTIKEIVIEDDKFKKYIKVPFGCILTIKNIE